MTEVKLFTKPGLAPARQPILKRLKAVIDGRIKIGEGPQATEFSTNEALKKGNIPPSLCVMEATSYILGYDLNNGLGINDSPPCTSEAITELMIGINDAVTDRKRAMLKQVIPDIINTAPLVWAIDKNHGCLRDEKGKCCRDKNKNRIFPERLATNFKDPDYNAAENQRAEMIDAFFESQPKKKDKYKTLRLSDHNEIPMTKWIPFIRELVAVAKFDQANSDTEVDMTTPPIDLDDSD